MLSFLTNDKEYELRANNQISVILAQFDSDFVMNVIEDTIAQRLSTFNMIPYPNAVQSYETIFKELTNMYPTDTENIEETRMLTYRAIIDIITKWFQIDINDNNGDEYIDLYTLCYYLYDFFISRFNNYMVAFYDQYIDDQKEEIYNTFHLEDMRKERDMSSNYSRISFGEDDVMAYIVANLPLVLNNLKNLPVTDKYIYQVAYCNNVPVLNLFEDYVSPRTSLFETFNKILFNEKLYPTIITHIRIAIQQSHAKKIEDIEELKR